MDVVRTSGIVVSNAAPDRRPPKSRRHAAQGPCDDLVGFAGGQAGSPVSDDALLARCE